MVRDENGYVIDREISQDTDNRQSRVQIAIRLEVLMHALSTGKTEAIRDMGGSCQLSQL